MLKKLAYAMAEKSLVDVLPNSQNTDVTQKEQILELVAIHIKNAVPQILTNLEQQHGINSLTYFNEKLIIFSAILDEFCDMMEEYAIKLSESNRYYYEERRKKLSHQEIIIADDKEKMKITKDHIPNTFAPNATNEYFTLGGIIVGLRSGAFTDADLPPEVNEMLRTYRPIPKNNSHKQHKPSFSHMSDIDESKHVRTQSGSPKGGQFTEKSDGSNKVYSNTEDPDLVKKQRDFQFDLSYTMYNFYRGLAKQQYRDGKAWDVDNQEEKMNMLVQMFSRVPSGIQPTGIKGELAPTEKTPYNPDTPYHEDHFQKQTGEVMDFAQLQKYKDKVFSTLPKNTHTRFFVNPFENEMPFDMDNPEHILKKHAKIVEQESMDPSMDVYIVGITNNTSANLTHELSEGFLRAGKMVKCPFLNGLQNEKNVKYLNVSIPMQFNNDQEASEYAGSAELYQESTLVLRKDGKCDFLDSVNKSGNKIDKEKDTKCQPIKRQ